MPLLSGDPEVNPIREQPGARTGGGRVHNLGDRGRAGDRVRAGREQGAPWEAGDHSAPPRPPSLRRTGAARAHAGEARPDDQASQWGVRAGMARAR